jgi:hypothetical protein
MSTTTCPRCRRSLRSLNSWHNCVNVSIDSLFEGKDAELVLAFDKLLAEVADWQDVQVSTTQNCIVFLHRQTFLIIRPMSRMLDIKFYSAEAIQDGLVKKSIPYAGKYENHVRLSTSDEVTGKVFFYLRRSYDLL